MTGAAMRFRDRADAGRRLLRHVEALGPLHDAVVLGLPRGGIPVAAEVARGTRAPLDVFVSRKVGAPGHEEFGIGAVAEGGTRVADPATLERLGLSTEDFDRLADREDEVVAALVARYRPGRDLPHLPGRTVVLVDDGLATGVTAEAALLALRARDPARLILAVPVCAADSARRLAGIADDLACVHEPEQFHAVGAWYDDFAQTTDDQVLRALTLANPDPPQ